jgi:type II secretory pathway predicted ATPase ExeA
MYEEFYRLNHRPFLTVPDPDYLYWAEAHTLAFTMLRYGLMARAPITVVTGEIGAGKTTLLRQLLREIPADVEVGLISNMQAGRGELLEWVLMALGRPVEGASYIQMFQTLQAHVVDAYAAGKRVVLIFDEAQNMGVDTLEELRMLSNINADKDELLQIVLVGQPQLRDLIKRPELVQFAQRVSADFHLGALGQEDVDRYIQHRLSVAGAQWRIFPSRTCDLIHHATGGVPRLINVLGELCLVYGFSAESRVIEEPLLREFLNNAQSRGLYDQFRPLEEGPKLVRNTK